MAKRVVRDHWQELLDEVIPFRSRPPRKFTAQILRINSVVYLDRLLLLIPFLRERTPHYWKRKVASHNECRRTGMRS
jgi:hypothetical protein